MPESEEAIADLIASIGETQRARQQHPHERRAHERIAKTGSVVIFPCNGVTIGRSMPASLRDISRGGIGICASQSLPVGSGFVLGLRHGQGKATVMLYTVRRCLKDPDTDGVIIGAQLDRILRDSDIRDDDPSPLHRVGRALQRADNGRAQPELTSAR